MGRGAWSVDTMITFDTFFYYFFWEGGTIRDLGHDPMSAGGVKLVLGLQQPLIYTLYILGIVIDIYGWRKTLLDT